jgi:ribonucleoside-diphosphate reductase alpha chain
MSNLSPFAETIFKRTYAFTETETWEGCAARVAKFVASGNSALEKRFFEAINARKFIPGGRYLYSAGRDLPQTTNCFLLKAEDSREGWGKLINKHMVALSTGGGVGTWYGDIRPKGTPIGRYGGVASGPVSLMRMTNEVAREVMAGGKRRSALWAGLPWHHPDIEEFITAKSWSTDIRAMKERDFNFPAPLDMMNISVCLDDEFFKLAKKDLSVWDLYYRICKLMCKTGEPGFSIDVKEKKNEVLRNPCVAGDTDILTDKGYFKIKDLIGIGAVNVWNGIEWSKVTPTITGQNEPMITVYLSDGTSLRCTEAHRWILDGGVRVLAKNLKVGDKLHKFTMPVVHGGDKISWAYTQGFFSGDGFEYKGKKRSWLYGPKRTLVHRLDTTAIWKEWNGRIGVTFPDHILEKTFVPFHWSEQSKLNWLAGLLDSDGCEVRNKNSSGIQLGSIDKEFLLNIRKMLTTLGVQAKVTRMRESTKGYLPDGKGNKYLYEQQEFWRLLINATDTRALLNLGLTLDRLRIRSSNPNRDARRYITVEKVETSGHEAVVYCFKEPKNNTGCFDGVITGQCTEVVSDTDSDCCNLGSINLGRISSLSELEDITRLATRFLYLGTFVGWLPHEDFKAVREKNRRIGLGIMGLHEWCLKNDQKYEPTGNLGKWLATWQRVSDEESAKVAAEMNSVTPVAVRAVAPTGTIGILGETTTGIEPIFCVAYKRRWLDNNGKWKFTYVVDPTAARLIQAGIAPEDIEDANTLATSVERRIAMQAFVQGFVDQAISSTINVPEYGEYGNSNVKKFSEVLFKYLPRLRGLTVYPEGSRPGQPITPINYETAIRHKDVSYEEERECVGGVCGI